MVGLSVLAALGLLAFYAGGSTADAAPAPSTVLRANAFSPNLFSPASAILFVAPGGWVSRWAPKRNDHRRIDGLAAGRLAIAASPVDLRYDGAPIGPAT
jgi:hypothetical protein